MFELDFERPSSYIITLVATESQWFLGRKESNMAMRATKIKMKQNCLNSNNLLEIDQIYLEGCTENGYYYKEAVHNFLKEHPNSIEVNLFPYPDLQPAISQNGEKYVRSEANNSLRDNLLMLPRE